MGAILERTRAMGPYSVEVRSQSFYLNRACSDREACPAKVVRGTVVCLPPADLPSLVHALRAVADHPAYQSRPMADAGVPDAPRAPWRVELTDDGQMLEIEGGWCMASQEDRRQLPKPGMDYLIGTEVLYADVEELLALMGAAEPSGPPV